MKVLRTQYKLSHFCNLGRKSTISHLGNIPKAKALTEIERTNDFRTIHRKHT